MITEAEIYQLAWREQLSVWGMEKEHFERSGSELAKARTENAWQKLKELEAIIKAKGFN